MSSVTDLSPIYYICHSYTAFQKDQIENIPLQKSEIHTFVRTNPLFAAASRISPGRFRNIAPDAKINRVSLPRNCHVYQTPVTYLPLDFDYQRMGERHFRAVGKVIRDEKIAPPSLMHAHFIWSSGYAGMRLKEKYGVPFIVTGHGYDVYDIPFRSAAWKKRICQVLNAADHIITVSRTNLECLEKLGVETPVSVIPNGFNARQFHPTSREESRNTLGLPPDRKIILTVGNCNRDKGQWILIEAMTEIQRLHPDVLCIIVGSGELYPALQKKIADLGLQGSVIMPGAKPHAEIPLWMNACDIFVLPSLNESFGVVNIEALACGKPVVASNAGGIPEILIADSYGLLCEPGNPADLSKKIIQALNTEWDSQAIREYAQRYTLDTVTKEILAVYGKYL